MYTFSLACRRWLGQNKKNKNFFQLQQSLWPEESVLKKCYSGCEHPQRMLSGSPWKKASRRQLQGSRFGRCCVILLSELFLPQGAWIKGTQRVLKYFGLVCSRKLFAGCCFVLPSLLRSASKGPTRSTTRKSFLAGTAHLTSSVSIWLPRHSDGMCLTKFTISRDFKCFFVSSLTVTRLRRSISCWEGKLRGWNTVLHRCQTITH